jgi:gluconate 2-dehydrogenase alpha chain
MATEKTDVVIVGMGAVGGVMAAELGKAGLKVIGLERGPRLKTADFQLDELRYFQRKDLRPSPKTQPVTWRPNANAPAMRLPQMDYGNQAGGGTVHYGAVSWRLHEDDFRARSHTIERYGVSAIPQDSSLADWPLSYAELERFYDQTEYDIGVSGKAGNLQGRKIDGGNPFEAPRQREYPLPPLTKDQPSVLFEAGAKKLGHHPFSTPHAILSQPYKGRPACTYCTYCQAFGCYIGAKSSILVSKLPEADATGNFTLKTGAMCYRINSKGKRVTGVSYYGPDGSENTIEAEIVVLGTFIYDNTRLLLLSKTDAFPNGLANSSGHVGKHLMAHMMPNVFVGFDDRHVNTRQHLHGTECSEVHDRRFQRRQFRPWRRRLHPRLADFGGHAQPRGRTDQLLGRCCAARRAARGRGVPRRSRQVSNPVCRNGGADREPRLRGPDHRSRSQRARPVGPAGAAAHL